MDVTLPALMACVSHTWSPGIGDPDVTGWLTVVAYSVCGFLAIAVLAKGQIGRRGRWLWRIIAVAMVLLAINKQLDLQSALTAAGRCVAQMQGWYGERRGVQVLFIKSLLTLFGVLMVFGLIALRRELGQNLLALLGMILVGGFVALRAVGFHHFDALISASAFEVRYNTWFELSGLVLITAGAVQRLWAARG